jgi:F-type H+-transporting ATPase subunit delta
MSEKAVALRYAQPLLELALEQNALDKVYEDMILFKETGEENPELLAILRNPIIKGHKKLAILKGLFESKVQKLTVSIFEIMSRKNRESILHEMSKQFIELYYIEKGIQIVRIETSVALSDALKKELKDKLAQELQKTIILKEEVKSELLGGFILHIGNSQIDNSIKNSLQRLKLNFIKTVYN